MIFHESPLYVITYKLNQVSKTLLVTGTYLNKTLLLRGTYLSKTLLLIGTYLSKTFSEGWCETQKRQKKFVWQVIF